MIAALQTIGGLTLITGLILAYTAARAASPATNLNLALLGIYALGAVSASLLWFAIARILANQQEIMTKLELRTRQHSRW